MHFLNSADSTISEPGTRYTTETHFSKAFEGFNVKCGILVVVVVVLRKEEIEDTKGIHIKQLVR